MELWIVGKNLSYDNLEWEFQGVFSSRQLAEAACRTEFYFTGPALLNEELPDTTVEWSGVFRPLQQSVHL